MGSRSYLGYSVYNVLGIPNIPKEKCILIWEAKGSILITEEEFEEGVEDMMEDMREDDAFLTWLDFR